MSNPLEYDHDTSYLPDDCVLKISPSKFSSFISKKHQWYREVVLKEDGFMGSTSSVIGTIVHYVAECVASKSDIDKDAIYEYIESSKSIGEEYCADTVIANIEQMSSVLVNEYVIPNMDNYLEVETVHTAGLGYGIYASGKLDALEGTKDDCCIVDYKTYNSKSTPKTIPQAYKYQLLVYAFLLNKNGYNPTRIKLVYVNRNIDGGVSEKTGKALKSYPPQVTVLVESITDEDIEFIGGLLDLCADSVLAGQEYPELLHVIWNDPRLKGE
tara:strand:- start:106 stop:915 length:810 start_codon:yes stop_codon:yes gene_type:complete